jgi:radical SAM protein with 4Fe4S-binding SPASM domain
VRCPIQSPVQFLMMKVYAEHVATMKNGAQMIVSKLNENYVIHDDFSVTPLPRVIRLEASSVCNLKCMYCPTGTKHNNSRGKMNTEVFGRIVDEIKSYNGVDVAVLYHGGESFLNKNIFRMIRELRAIGIDIIKTSTNGTAFNEKMLVDVIESGLDSITFSIDGLSPQENNWIRKGADYFETANTIKRLIALKREMNSKMPEIRIANTQIPDEETIRSGKEISTPRYLLDDFAEFKDEVIFEQHYTIKWPGYECSAEYVLVGPPSAGLVEPSNYCDHVVQLITFRWNGDVVPCCFDITSEYVVGNITVQSLAEIWNNERYRKLRKSICNGNYMPMCASCQTIRPQLYMAKRDAKS